MKEKQINRRSLEDIIISKSGAFLVVFLQSNLCDSFMTHVHMYKYLFKENMYDGTLIYGIITHHSSSWKAIIL